LIRDSAARLKGVMMRDGSWSAGERAEAGDGERAARVREFLRETTLGPQAEWSPVLRMACDLCLGVRFPLALWWGDELTFVYNDAYRQSLGASKHPGAGALGRATNARERNLPGMGLGLYVSRRSIGRHGGTLAVASPGDGQGTMFVLWVPGGSWVVGRGSWVVGREKIRE